MANSSETFLTELSEYKRKIGYRLQKLPPIKNSSVLDYDNLKQLTQCMENGRKSSEEKHKFFMENYQTIFKGKKDELSIKKSNASFVDRSSNRKKPAKLPEKPDIHNISMHLSQIRKRAGSPIKEAVSEERMKVIRKLGKKLPFDRSSKENQQLLQCLSCIECFSEIPKKVLSRLVATAQMEKWEANYTVFGDSGLYLILKGSVSPQSRISYIDKHSLSQREDSSLSVWSETDSALQFLFKLGVGEYFGTLEKFQETPNTRHLSVLTCEDCELLRFSNTSYERVVKQVKEEEGAEKLHLAQSCKMFKDWPVLALKRISQTFTWSKIPAGTSLLLEGETANCISFIKTGRCQLKKKLNVAFTYPDGRKVMKKRELVTGILTTGDSYGEWSFISGLTAEQSVISETPLLIASLNHNDIKGLDDVTRALFRQTCEATDSGTSEEIIKKNYVEKQAELEWQAKKDEIINETLYYRGIMPGYSKWSRNPSSSDSSIDKA
eukprot:gene18596-20462_t